MHLLVKDSAKRVSANRDSANRVSANREDTLASAFYTVWVLWGLIFVPIFMLISTPDYKILFNYLEN